MICYWLSVTVSEGLEFKDAKMGDSGWRFFMKLQSDVSWGWGHPKASWGLEDPFPFTWLASWCWLLAGGLRSPSHGLFTGPLECPHGMAASFPYNEIFETQVELQCLVWPGWEVTHCHFLFISFLFSMGGDHTRAWLPRGHHQWGPSQKLATTSFKEALCSNVWLILSIRYSNTEYLKSYSPYRC